MGVAVPGEVRDFCREGLYLAFADARAAQAAAAWGPQARVEVSFTALDGERPQVFHIAGTVVHKAAGGLGLHVPTMPEGALQALRAACGGVATGAGHGSSAATGPAAASVLDECARIVDDALAQVSEDFFARVGDRLLGAAEKTANLRDRQRLRDTPLLLGTQRARIHEALVACLREQREQLHPSRESRALARPDEEPGELSLVDETQLEDSLNVSAVAHQVETGGSFGRSLAAVEQRYGEAVGKVLDRQTNPFGPLALCRAFQSATGGVELCQQGRAIVYKSFGEALARHLPKLYEQLERALPAREEPRRPKRPADPLGAPGGTVRPLEGEAAHGAAAGAADPQGWYSPAPYPDLAAWQRATSPGPHPGIPHPASLPMDARGFAGGSVAPAFGSQPQGLASVQATGQPPGQVPGQGLARGHDAIPPGAPGRAEASGPGLLRVADALLRAAMDVDGGGAPLARAPSRGAVPATGSTSASLQDVSQAIDARMPASGGEPAGPAGLPLSERISRAIEGLDVPAPMRQALDRTGSLMGHAMAASGGGPAIDALLARLEQPLLKLSLNDGAFPGVPEHPARQVVDLLEQYAIAADDQGRFLDPKLQRFLHAAVDRICTTADREPGVYAATRDSLARLYPPVRQARQTRIARLQEACEGRHRILQARERVRAALEDRLAGRVVPQVVLDLMDAGWRQHLVLQELRGGVGGEGWTQSLAVLDRLRALLQPQPTPASAEARQELATLPSLIEQQLVGVNLDADQREAVMARLTQALDAVVRHGRAPDTVTVARHGRAAEPGPAGGDPALAHGALLQRLRVGDWWHFQEAGKWLPMQLIWLSEPAGDCAFANRSATQKVDLTLAEFGQRLREGEVRAWADQDRPLLERSVHAMMDDGAQRLQQRATQDAVTGLPSRKGLLQRLAQAARQAPAERAHVLCVIEFDQFRVVCQALGAEAGDSLSRAMAAEVGAVVATDGELASFRDDTLALFLPGCGRDQAQAVVDRVLGRLRDYRYQAGEHSFSIGANIGMAEYDPGQHSPEAAVQQADMACVASKARGRNRAQYYEPDDLQLESQRSMIEVAGRLDNLLAGEGLYLRGQMVMPIGADASLLPYHEVLLGIDGGGGRPIKPLPFILGVERLQRAHEVDLWVLRRVFDWIRDNPFGFATVGGFSINLSTMSLANAELIAYLHETLSRDDVPASRISFEITETSAIECYAAAGDFIRQMRRYGCKFALDDFGSGHTSYAHLKNLRVDTLKIDGSFVRDIVDSPSDFAIVKSMNDIAHSLGMLTVAEYVESPAILARLREIGIDYAQGYAIHKPCPIDQIVVLEPA